MQSMGSLKRQVHNYRSELEQFARQLPAGDAQDQIQEMIDTYMELEGAMDRVVRARGVEDEVNRMAGRIQRALVGTAVQAQEEALEEAAHRARNVAGKPDTD